MVSASEVADAEVGRGPNLRLALQRRIVKSQGFDDAQTELLEDCVLVRGGVGVCMTCRRTRGIAWICAIGQLLSVQCQLGLGLESQCGTSYQPVEMETCPHRT